MDETVFEHQVDREHAVRVRYVSNEFGGEYITEVEFEDDRTEMFFWHPITRRGIERLALDDAGSLIVNIMMGYFNEG